MSSSYVLSFHPKQNWTGVGVFAIWNSILDCPNKHHTFIHSWVVIFTKWFDVCFSRTEVQNHSVRWDNNVFKFPAKMTANASSGVLEACKCRVSVRYDISLFDKNTLIRYFVTWASTTEFYVTAAEQRNSNLKYLLRCFPKIIWKWRSANMFVLSFV